MPTSQGIVAVAPRGQYEPNGHLVHEPTVRGESEYDPGGHRSHVLAEGLLLEPAGHSEQPFADASSNA